MSGDFKEGDVVRLACPIPELHLGVGAKGRVVGTYEGGRVLEVFFPAVGRDLIVTRHELEREQ